MKLTVIHPRDVNYEHTNVIWGGAVIFKAHRWPEEQIIWGGAVIVKAHRWPKEQ